VLAIEPNSVDKAGSITIGRLPQAGAFSADSSRIYVGSILETDLSVSRVDGTNFTDTGQRFKMLGQHRLDTRRPAITPSINVRSRHACRELSLREAAGDEAIPMITGGLGTRLLRSARNDGAQFLQQTFSRGN
jgi:hypothetical protein